MLANSESGAFMDVQNEKACSLAATSNGSAEFDDLRRAVADNYDVVSTSYAFGSINLDVISLSDPDSLLDEATLNAAHGDMAWHPYWGKLWDSAIGLASILADQDLTGRDVLDLGCGLGITGTVAAARGAQVVLADHAPPALDFARLNSWSWRERVEVTFVDWRTSDLGREFDLIVGADIVYDRQDVPFLDRFWKRHLKSGGTILLTDPARLMTLDLMPLIQAAGWKIDRRPLSTPLLTKPVNVFTLTLV